MWSVKKARLSGCPELIEEWQVSKKSQQLRNQTNIRGSLSFLVDTQHQMPSWGQDVRGQAAAGPLKNVASSPVWQGDQDQKAGARSPPGKKN